jgi:hypothetical protein
MLIAMLALSLVGDARAPSCITADARVEQVISATRLEAQGQEYCQFRLYHTISDIDGDGQDDFLVVFSVEGVGGGGNHTIQFLAAFTSANEWAPTLVRVGARGERLVDAIDVDQGVIILRTLEYLKKDARCCPSGRGALRYRFQKGQLALVSNSTAAKRESAPPAVSGERAHPY